jgi:hypothetical protein
VGSGRARRRRRGRAGGPGAGHDGRGTLRVLATSVPFSYQIEGAGFRSNTGVYNLNGLPVTVSFDLYRSDGTLLGTKTLTWQDNEAYRLTDIFGVLGAGGTVTENAYLVVTAAAAVFPWVAVIDNQTGDQVWVLPFDAEAAPESAARREN